MSAQEHRRYEEELAAYLLDALSASEAEGFRAHLDTCARCQAEQRWLRAAVEVLPSSVEQIEPPPALRKRLMETVRAEAASEARPQTQRSSMRRWRALLLRPATALATVAVAVAALAGYLIRGEDGAKTTTVPVQATAAEPAARATLVRYDRGALLRVERLPVQRRGRVYQVWLMRGKRLEPSSLFAVRKDGSGAAAIPGGLEDVQVVMVSDEPEGGSRRPTTQPLLRANL